MLWLFCLCYNRGLAKTSSGRSCSDLVWGCCPSWKRGYASNSSSSHGHRRVRLWSPWQPWSGSREMEASTQLTCLLVILDPTAGGGAASIHSERVFPPLLKSSGNALSVMSTGLSHGSLRSVREDCRSQTPWLRNRKGDTAYLPGCDSVQKPGSSKCRIILSSGRTMALNYPGGVRVKKSHDNFRHRFSPSIT